VLLARSPFSYNILRVASAVYLIYLGVQSLRSRPDNQREPNVTGPRRPTCAYREGLVNNALNPKGILFYLGVFSQLITREMTLGETTALIAAMVSVSVVFWTVFIQTLQIPLIRVGLSRWKVAIDRVFGVVLIGFGARIAVLS
jgi:threonine/homoserine/homoserine lactone efflux protein